MLGFLWRLGATQFHPLQICLLRVRELSGWSSIFHCTLNGADCLKPHFNCDIIFVQCMSVRISLWVKRMRLIQTVRYNWKAKSTKKRLVLTYIFVEYWIILHKNAFFINSCCQSGELIELSWWSNVLLLPVKLYKSAITKYNHK